MRSLIFAKRTGKEILRDPLTFLFCLGFPLVMLVIMTIVNNSIPKQAEMTIFELVNLTPGITVFGLTFVMQFICLQISKDRAGAFLVRLYASPMKPFDFIAGYTLPILLIAFFQGVITMIAAMIIGGVAKAELSFVNLFLSVLVLFPSTLIFIGLGLLFGTFFGEKAAPGICSILITVAAIVGGIWMDVDAVGGVFMKISHAFPFYQSVQVARMAANGQYEEILKPFLITVIYAVAIYFLAVFALHKRMKKDVS